jgi:hypothetical protein
VRHADLETWGGAEIPVVPDAALFAPGSHDHQRKNEAWALAGSVPVNHLADGFIVSPTRWA